MVNNEQTNDTDSLVNENDLDLPGINEDLQDMIESEEPKEGLPLLARKIMPYTLGIASGILKYIPIIFATIWGIIWKNTFGRLFDWQKNADQEKEYILRNVLGMSDRVVYFYDYWFSINPNLGRLSFIFFMIYGMICNLGAELVHIRAKVLQQVNKDAPISLPDPNQILLTYLMQYTERDTAYELLAKLGYNEETINVMYDSLKKLVPLETLITNLWRRDNWEGEFTKQLARMGFDSKQQDMIHKIVDVIPPISDIIRMSVREAFDDELSSAFSHDDDYQEAVSKWAGKQGLSSYWAKMYWRAHWELPSVQLGFEMLHRRCKKDNGETFTKDDLFMLLRMQDYAPGWRSLIEQCSYNVITRVDTRRMYALGVWDNLPDMSAEEKVKQIYMDMGYNEQDAEALKDFTVKYTYEQRRDISLSGLKRLVLKGIMDIPEFKERMTEMKYHEQDILLAVDELNYELDEEKLNAFLDKAESYYKNDRWSEADVMTEMSKAGIAVQRPENLFETWKYQKESLRKLLTKTDILDMTKKGLIADYKESISRLVKLGYSDADATLLIEEIIYDMGTDIRSLYNIGRIKTRSDAIDILVKNGMTSAEASNQITEYYSDLF